jgi:hypothetical protein
VAGRRGPLSKRSARPARSGGADRERVSAPRDDVVEAHSAGSEQRSSSGQGGGRTRTEALTLFGLWEVAVILLGLVGLGGWLVAGLACAGAVIARRYDQTGTLADGPLLIAAGAAGLMVVIAIVVKIVSDGRSADSAGRPLVVRITDPAENQPAADGTIVRGRSNLATVVSRTCWENGCSSSLPRSQRTIWILTQPAGLNRYYPQGSWPDQAGPAASGPTGKWASPAVSFGAAPRGGPVLIHAVLADRDAEEVFKDYLREGFAAGTFPGLTRGQFPNGAQLLDSVRVVVNG